MLISPGDFLLIKVMNSSKNKLNSSISVWSCLISNIGIGKISNWPLFSTGVGISRSFSTIFITNCCCTFLSIFVQFLTFSNFSRGTNETEVFDDDFSFSVLILFVMLSRTAGRSHLECVLDAPIRHTWKYKLWTLRILLHLAPLALCPSCPSRFKSRLTGDLHECDAMSCSMRYVIALNSSLHRTRVNPQ